VPLPGLLVATPGRLHSIANDPIPEYFLCNRMCMSSVSAAVLQVLELRHGADLLVATPGRLLELLAKKTVSLARLKLLVGDMTIHMLYDMLHDMLQSVMLFGSG
jgi:hypothetical protein